MAASDAITEPPARVRFLACVLVAFLLVGWTTVAAAPPAAANSSNAQARQMLVKKLNKLRKSKGLKPLTVSPALQSVAQKWSKKQHSRGSLQHNSQVGSQIPNGWQRWGENVGWAWGYPSNADVIHEGWVNSPGHYANLTRKEFTHVGIGYFSTPSGGAYATQVFATYPAKSRPKVTKVSPKKTTGKGWKKITVHGKNLRGTDKAKVGKLRVQVRKVTAKKVVLRVRVVAKGKAKLRVTVRTPLGWTDKTKKTMVRLRR